MDEITSIHNPLVKLVRSLSARKHRTASGLFAVEGIEYALKAKAHRFKPHLLLIARDFAAEPRLSGILAWARGEGARFAAVSPALMARLSQLNNPQALILICHQRWSESVLDLPGDAVLLALDRIRDPGNLGTIMRSAEATGVTRLCLIAESCDPFSPEALRASAGSLFAMDIVRLSRDAAADLLRRWPGDSVATALKAQDDFRQRYRHPVLLLMGSESEGLADDLRALCKRNVRIPMAPGVESLNLATATALMLYEVQLPLLERHART
jgi:TrmH family RNA methyltransferase